MKISLKKVNKKTSAVILLVVFIILGSIFLVHKQHISSKQKMTNGSTVIVNEIKEQKATLPLVDPFKPRGYHLASSSVYYYDQKIDGADPVTFTKLNDWFAKDKNSVYYIATILQDADPETFRVSSTTSSFFVKDKNSAYINGSKIIGSYDAATVEAVNYNVIKDSKNVYYLGNYDPSSQKVEVIKGADSATFQFVGTCASVEKSYGYYFKDKNHVYVENKIMPYIDAPTFEFLGEFPNQDGGMPYSISYAKDKNRVYISCGGMDEKIDRNTFKILDKEYAQDDYNIIFMGKILEGADRTTFTRIDESYAKDKNNIYLYGMAMKVDMPTWKVLSPYMSLDKNFVYVGSTKSTVYDRATFSVLSGGYFRDKNGIYNGEEKINILSTSTFKVLGGGYAVDSKRVYYSGCYNAGNLRDANPLTFEVIDKDRQYSKDKNNVYSNCSVIPELDPATTVSIGYGYLKDKNIIYARGAKLINIDFETFHPTGEYTQEDKNYFYEDNVVKSKK